jgi:hypothetical protein
MYHLGATDSLTHDYREQLQIIVCADGAAGINFERTVDGHTVLRYVLNMELLFYSCSRGYQICG